MNRFVVPFSSTSKTCRLSILYVLVFFVCGVQAQPRPESVRRTRANPIVLLSCEHVIGVRAPNGVGEFYNKGTDATFVVRGNNYVRLADQPDPFGGHYVYHANFNTGLYDAPQSEAALLQMEQDGYNTVRVFINELNVGNSSATGLSASYIDNFTDFLNRAKNHGIFVIPILGYLPKSGGYYSLIAPDSNIAGYNTFYLNPTAYTAKTTYIHDFITELAKRAAPLDTIVAYSLENEQFYERDKAPLSWTTGLVTTYTGTFDMADPVSRQQMMDSNLVAWTIEMRNAILAEDPTALVTIGFFRPFLVGEPDNRLVRTYWVIQDNEMGGSTVDFVDLHIYPGFDPLYLTVDLADTMRRFEAVDNSQRKPRVLGEFGAFKSQYVDVTSAAYALRDLQVATCQTYNFSGWLTWTWDTAEQPELWNALDGEGAINGVLAPIARYDACNPNPNSP